MSHQMPSDIAHHAWQCRHDFTAKRSNELSITRNPMSRGEVVRRDEKNPAWVYVLLEGSSPRVAGYVPLTHITIGSGRCDEPFNVMDYGVLDTTSLSSTLNLSVSGFPSAGLFDKAVSALVIAFKENVGKFGLTGVSDQVRSMISGNASQVASVAHRIIQGTSAVGLYDILCRFNFSADDILQAPDRWNLKQMHYLQVHAGIYWIVYEDEAGMRFAYVGKSNNMVKRLFTHRSHATDQNAEDYNCYHYRVARKARTVYAMALCLLNEPNNAGILAIAEQVFLLLLQTYRPNLLNFRPGHSHEATTWLTDYEHAMILSNIGRKAMERSGWPGACLVRPDEFKVDEGINWNSPLCEHRYDKTVWVRTQSMVRDPDDSSRTIPVANYRRSTPRVLDTKSRLILKVRRKGIRPAFALVFPVHNEHLKYPAKERQLVQVFAEIRLDGKKHPECYARLPDFGCWEDWENANSLALGCEYEDQTGQWRRLYIKTLRYQNHDEITPQLRDYDKQGHNSNYAEATALLRYFNMETWDPRYMRGFDYNFGIARVKIVQLNWLTQTLEFREMQEKSVIPRNRKLTTAELVDKMNARTDLELLGVGGAWRGFPPRTGRSRRNCDACLINAPVRVGGRACKQLATVPDPNDGSKLVPLPNENRCSNCHTRTGMPCSWTPDITTPPTSARSSQWLPITRLQHAALVETPYRLNAQPIDPPAISILEPEKMEESTGADEED